MSTATLFEFPRPDAGFVDGMRRLSVDGGPAWPDRLGAALRREFDRLGEVPTLSLFAGGGGLDIGFHDVGLRALEAVEIEPRYAQSLDANNGTGELLEGTRVLCMDIRDYDPAEARAARFVIGGPPCQTFSAAGRRASGVLGTNDERGMLFQEYVRILRDLEPEGFLFENVYGITGAQNGEAWRRIVEAFRELGFIVSHRVLDAADYGAPQYRERMIIVGTREEAFAFPRPTHGPDSPDDQPYYAAGEAVDGAPHEGVPGPVGGRFGHLLEEVPPGLNYSFFTREMGHPRPVFAWRSKFSDLLYKADPKRPVRTIKAQCGQFTGPFHWQNRSFSIAELKRLQTFPDEYDLLGTPRSVAEQIGNSVPPQLARMLALAVREQVFGDESPIKLSYLESHETLGFRARKRAQTHEYKRIAAEAIAAMSTEPSMAPAEEPTVKWRSLGEKFAWIEQAPRARLARKVRATLRHDFLRITVGDARHGTRVSIGPNAKAGWALPISGAEFTVGRQPLDITAGWKAFEEEVRERFGFADLVQASGYYVYEQQIASRIVRPGGDGPMWQLLQGVTAGQGIGLTAPLERLAEAWGLHVDEVGLHALLRDLKGIGFEVRSSRTNPQIPRGEYLVPYSFPTLTPRSVQRSKSL